MTRSKQIYKIVILLLCAPVLSFGSASARPAEHGASPIVLAQAGTSRYVIAVAGDAIPAERTAARELREYVRKISGATLPIENEAQVAANQPQILVGAGERARRLASDVDWDALGSDGIVIKSVGKNLILAGGRPRGSLYAVDTFLENTLGVRWWAPGETSIPTQPTIRIPTQNTTYIPRIRYREYYSTGPVSDPEYATHLKLNGNYENQTPDWGGHYSILGFVHTFAKLLPPEKYFHAHPEWYSDPANDNKPCTSASKMPADAVTWQLNLMDEGARQELTKNALDWIRANPDAGMISISQNDSRGMDECNTPEERAMAEREGSPSGPLLHFVNAVAADIEKQYPNFLVETLAYQFTAKPPRFERPRRNVLICLCTYGDYARPLGSDANKSFRDQMIAWKSIAPRLFVWDYVTNFSNFIFPHPNMHMLGPNIRFFAANNTIGLYDEGFPSGGAGDFDALRIWISAHMMWDPRLDQKELASEFLNGYYGPAAPYLGDYIDSIQKAFLNHGGPLSLDQQDDSYLTLDVMNHATDDFRAAEKAVAGNAVLTRRVRRESVAFDHAWLLRYTALHEEATRRKAVFEGPEDPEAFAKAFIQTAREFHVQLYREAESFDDYAQQVIGMFQPALPLPDFLRGVDANDIVDISPSWMRLADGAKIVPDPASSTEYAAEMPGNINTWGVQYQTGNEKLAAGQWHCYVLARVDARETATQVPLSYGIYNVGASKDVFLGSQPLKGFIPGKYRLLDLGVHSLTPDMYVWIATPNRQDVSAIYVGRILFVRS